MTAKDKVSISHEFLTSRMTRTALVLCGVLSVADGNDTLTGTPEFELSGRRFPSKVLWWGGFPVRGGRRRVCLYVLTIPIADLESLPIQSAVHLVCTTARGDVLRRRLRFSRFRPADGLHRGRLHRIQDGDLTVYARQTGRGQFNVTARGRNVTDSVTVFPRILAARLAALVWRRPSILLFEKEGRHYEESASTLFEELVDRGRTDVRFVLDRTLLHRVGHQYHRFVVRRFSLRHFYHFFAAQTFIGTEGVWHAAEPHSASRLLQRRIGDRAFGYVFLQHGPTYMVSLASEQRRSFRAGGVIYPHGTKMVCSSELERAHFIQEGGFHAEDVYVTGLPKFDRAVRVEGADKILIMPTWRPWEFNAVRNDPTSSSYYRLLHALYQAVPPHLQSKTYLLPHPWIRESLVGTDLENRQWPGESHDEALRECAVLITDYSSIAYDAFYRGSNVIFWWKDKDDCMRRYGGELMIDEDSAFGPVCYDAPQLARLVESSYGATQNQEHVRRYRRIIEFSDNRNTQRVIEALTRDGMI